MKKFYLILVFVFAITAVIGTANATVKKCVPLVDGTQTRCSNNGLVPYDYHADWAATCTTNGVPSEIKGVGFCSNQAGKAFADTSETITTSDNATQNTNCWCKMTSPAVSLWVFRSGYGDAGSCAMSCAGTCAFTVLSTPARSATYRSALFSNLGE